MISKVICNKLKTFLSDLIAPNQSAFLKGWLITDNIVARRNTKSRAPDMEKKKEEDAKLWKGIIIGRNTSGLTHLMYSDDTVHFKLMITISKQFTEFSKSMAPFPLLE
ncbi:retrotransposon protein, putative, unclassified [Senna tora]|uniref:Retrotransposon protein, putative, unclassified n=1 Tax=Senna tora TaxID=362788 RepID=A0A834W0V8_9FABA|nr:retrotransposon protein, putative, unclassified [Senna tora]